MNDFVAAPAPTSGGFNKEENLGRLLIIEIFGITKESGDYGEQDVIVGNVHVLDGAMAGHTYYEQTIYGRRLVGQARATLNAGASRMLGRLARGQAKKGQPPWILDNPSEADVAVAERWSEQAAGQPAAVTQNSEEDTAPEPVAVAPAASSKPPF